MKTQDKDVLLINALHLLEMRYVEYFNQKRLEMGKPLFTINSTYQIAGKVGDERIEFITPLLLEIQQQIQEEFERIFHGVPA